MKEQNSNVVNQNQKAEQHPLQTGVSEENVQAEKTTTDKEHVKATTVDPKNAKHGVDFCCGSCGG